MNKNILIILLIIVLVSILGYFFRGGSSEQGISVQPDNNVELNNNVELENLSSVGKYENYNQDKIAMAENGKVVLFFHASWCPSCRSLNSDIENNLNSIPEGVLILKTDYDKEVDLKRKYGITTQHSLVQVDKDGNLIKKWNGGSKLEDIISNIQ